MSNWCRRTEKKMEVLLGGWAISQLNSLNSSCNIGKYILRLVWQLIEIQCSPGIFALYNLVSNLSLEMQLHHRKCGFINDVPPHLIKESENLSKPQNKRIKLKVVATYGLEVFLPLTTYRCTIISIIPCAD